MNICYGKGSQTEQSGHSKMTMDRKQGLPDRTEQSQQDDYGQEADLFVGKPGRSEL